MGKSLVLRRWRMILGATLFGLGVGVHGAAEADGRLFAVQIASLGGDTSITVGLAHPLACRATIDAASGALRVDFPDLRAMPGTSIGHGTGLIRAYRAEPLGGGGVRLAFDLSRAAVIAGARALPAEAGKPPRIAIALRSATPAAMRAASGIVYRPGDASPTREASQAPDSPVQPRSVGAPGSIAALIGAPRPVSLAAEPATTPRPDTSRPDTSRPETPSPRRAGPLARHVIVIDAGHGGIDPGAPSVAGYQEKEVTLSTARMLARVLEESGRYRAVLTRDSDVFLRLRERVTLARAAHGDVFISLHADSAADGSRSGASGASIYTLSETASDAESERYAQRENRADAIGGVTLGDKSDDVAGILVDLTVRETVNEGNRLAGMLADSLQRDGISLLPRAPRRAAGFAVLKSPDIPSVLIEMGYLSDPSDARALADPRHQLRVAKAIADGVDRYFAWADSPRP